MTNEQIKEGNKLIAEFMAGGAVEVHHNQYHENWNELVPVIKKCWEHLKPEGVALIDNIDNALLRLDIFEVYAKVVFAIKWYNK